MPELPEVETVCRFLEQNIQKDNIESAIVNRYDLRKGTRIPADFISLVQGQNILSVYRKGKYILISLEKGLNIVVHLGMTGRLVLYKDKQDYILGKHDHVCFNLASGKVLAFSDPRRFGLVDLLKEEEIDSHKYFKEQGIDPLTDFFSCEWLQSALKNKRQPIKLALLDQKIISGLGNIYVCEALFITGISPLRPANELIFSEADNLVKTIKELLLISIKAGGTTFRDYRKADGGKGNNSANLKVYGREGEKCLECELSNQCNGIKRIVIGGRSTFFCPLKQK